MGTNVGTNSRYITRYVREHYVQKKIRRDVYEALVRWCGEDSINICLERALKVLVTNTVPNVVANTGANIGTNVKENVATTPPTVAPSPPPAPAQQPKPPTTAETQPAETKERKPQTYTWCRKKSEIRNFKGFLEWVDHSFELVDWWEEGEKYCFETRRSPKQEKGKKRGRGGGE